MAEPLGLLSALFTISTYASSYLKAFQGKSTRPQRLSPHCFLEIWDIASWLDPSGSQLQATQSLISARNELEVASALESLVQQRSGTLRVFLNEFDDKALVAYESRVMPAILPFHQQTSEQVLSPATSVEALVSLWRGTFGAHWYCLDGWTFLRPSDMSAGSSSATRPKAIQLDISQLVGQPDQRWVTTRRKLRFEEEDGRVKAFISCGTSFDRRTFRPCIATERFFSQLQDLEKIYTPLRTKSNLKKLFLLQYHHANLNMFSDMLLNISWQYAHRRKEAFDPRHSKLRQWNLKAILNDVDLYRQLLNIGIELQAVIGLLADLLLGQCEE
ncbi:hypothetical protein IQ06DRAFT_28427 [Phaeosphaeriaceae sp. SRC1lsM3a]|nr:hypothetical protein IQ06DRAFT_28427 [Stagonospora sp. SRC1lsM3a]